MDLWSISALAGITSLPTFAPVRIGRALQECNPQPLPAAGIEASVKAGASLFSVDRGGFAPPAPRGSTAQAPYLAAMNYAKAIASREIFKWCIEDRPCSPEVWDRVVIFHLVPLLIFEECTGITLVPSRRSCYRSRAWELSHKRPGSSLHTFPAGSRGACDLVRADGKPITECTDEIVRWLPHRRIALYPRNGFAHVDYGDRSGLLNQRRTLWHCSSPTAAWDHVSDLIDGEIPVPIGPTA